MPSCLRTTGAVAVLTLVAGTCVQAAGSDPPPAQHAAAGVVAMKTAPPPEKSPAKKPPPYEPSEPLPPLELPLRTLRGHSGDVFWVMFSPDGKLLATAGHDWTARLWDVATSQVRHTLAGHTEGVVRMAVFAPDGKRLATCSEDATIKLWDVDSGKQLSTLEGHTDKIWSVAFAPDGKTLASASCDRTVKVWDAVTAAPIATLSGHNSIVECVVLSPDGRWLVSGSWDGTFKLWDTATWKEKTTVPVKGHVQCLAFSPDGKTLAIGHAHEGWLTLWDVASSRERHVLAAHQALVQALAFSPDSKTLASSGRDGMIKLWDVQLGKEAAAFRGHRAWVWSLAFSPDAKTLASASGDRTVKLWDVSKRAKPFVPAAVAPPPGFPAAVAPAGPTPLAPQAPGATTPAPGDDTWELNIASFGKNEEENTEKLNQLAAEGWEYVGPLGDGKVAFKRRRKAVAKAPEPPTPIAVQGETLRSGLVAYYPLDGSAKDESGNGNHGAVHGATPCRDRLGRENRAFTFDGKDDYVEIPDSPSLRPAAATISLWIRINGFSSTKVGDNWEFQYVIFKQNSRDICFEGYVVALNDPRRVFHAGVASATGTQAFAFGAEDSAEAGRWYHLAMTASSSEISLYVNGKLVDSKTTGFPLDYDTKPLRIGRSNGLYDGFFNGDVDDLRIYNRVLALNEIQSLYGEPAPSGKTESAENVPGTGRDRPRSQEPAGVSYEDAAAQIQRLGGKLLAKGYRSSWSPDGSRIVFGDGAGLKILDLQSGRITPLVEPGKDPAWSPRNGQFIAYVRDDKEAEEVWLVESSGKNARKLADGGFPSWSEDQQTVFFHCRKERRVLSMAIDEPSRSPKVISEPMTCMYPAVSLDGKWIAFDREGDLAVVEAETGKTVWAWRPGRGPWCMSAWSPDGKRLAFGTLYDGLWVLQVESGQAVHVTTAPFTVPAWSKDGSKLALDLRLPQRETEIWMIEARSLDNLPKVRLPEAAPAVPAPGGSDVAPSAALESITASELKKHVDFLADDQREGRAAGSAGGRAAAEYLAAQLAALGLRGAGADDGYFQPFGAGYRNVLALLEGSDPQLKDQVVIVSAHYDHIGRVSGPGAGPKDDPIYNGADDNASGVAAVLELARAFRRLPHPPRRSILFAFWDAEERSMAGSKHWLAEPTIPKDRVVFMATCDMIGRLRNDRLILWGARSAYGLRRIIAARNPAPSLSIDFRWSVLTLADHYPFFVEGIPVLSLHTGYHPQFHRPDDESSLVDAVGIERVARLLFGVADDLANRPERLRFREGSRGELEHDPRQPVLPPPPPRNPPLPEGFACWRDDAEPGALVVSSVAPDSPAARAGLQPQDRIYGVNGQEFPDAADTVRVLRRSSGSVKLLVEQGGRLRTAEMQVTPASLTGQGPIVPKALPEPSGAKPGPDLPPPAARLPQGEWIDLLNRASLEGDLVKGQWTRRGQAITVAPETFARMMLPIVVQGSYDLEVEFTRNTADEAVLAFFPVGERTCSVALSAYDGAVSGFDTVDGQDVYDNPMSVRPGTLVNGSATSF